MDDAARVLTWACVDAVPAAAAYVFLPDQVPRAPGSDVPGPAELRWRVAGAINVRSLQTRLQLPATHWLIDTVVVRGEAVLVDGTDIVRARLAGAPLASRVHIAAVPLTALGAVVVLGRDRTAFSEGELVALAARAQRHVAVLADAISVRAMARRLERFTDHVI